MIEGLKFDIPGHVLRGHLLSRAGVHEAKAAESKEELVYWTGRARSGSDGAVPIMIADSRETAHRYEERAGTFRFMAESLVREETYRLSPNELIAIEFPGFGHGRT